MWISNAGVADWFFVLARTNPDPNARVSETLSTFIVERDWNGVSVSPKEWMMGQRCSDTRGMTFNSVYVPMANRVGREDEGFAIAMSTFNTSRPSVAAAAIGLARRPINQINDQFKRNRKLDPK